MEELLDFDRSLLVTVETMLKNKLPSAEGECVSLPLCVGVSLASLQCWRLSGDRQWTLTSLTPEISCSTLS